MPVEAAFTVWIASVMLSLRDAMSLARLICALAAKKFVGLSNALLTFFPEDSRSCVLFSMETVPWRLNRLARIADVREISCAIAFPFLGKLVVV